VGVSRSFIRAARISRRNAAAWFIAGWPTGQQPVLRPITRSDDMGMLRFRLTGSETGLAAMMSALEGFDRVDRVEEVGDLMGGMRDDSSSAQLSDDVGNSAAHDIEVHTSTSDAVADVHRAVERAAGELGVAVEFVDEF